MGVDGGLYKLVFLLHLVAVVVGFGTVSLDSVSAAIASKRGGREGVAIGEARDSVSKVAEGFVLATPVLGILLVVVSDGAWGFDQLWVGLALVLWFVAVSLSHAVLRPAARAVNRLGIELADMGPPPKPRGAAVAAPPPQVAQVERAEKRVAVAGAATNLILVVIIGLMIWKPM